MKPHDAPDNDQPASQRPDTDEDGLIRLQKLLAQSGVASRRKCEELMLDGLVEVDGEVVTRLGTKVDPRTAVIRVEGKRLPPISDKVYLVLNKPRGVVSTMSDPEGRRTLSRDERDWCVGEAMVLSGFSQTPVQLLAGGEAALARLILDTPAPPA